MGTSGEKYDKLTNHGRNDQVDPKTNQPIDTPTGIAMTKDERAKAPPAGQAPSTPDTTKPTGSTAPDPARVFFNPANSQLSFGGDLLITHTNSPVDSILGRGQFQIDPLIVIGPTDNGAIHLSDTAGAGILDTQTGQTLLDGFLLEAAYMPSTLPGFAGMIQGYVDIPPDFVGGTNNIIGSSFLQDISATSAAGGQPTFWFYADQPLFDAQGNSLIPEIGATGSMKFGVPAAVPEPSALVLSAISAIAGLVGCWWHHRRSSAHDDDRSAPADAQRLGMRDQGVDDELDVLVQVHAEPLGPAVDVVPLDLGGEALVLELLLDARRGERADPVRADEAAGHDEAGQLVAGQQRLVERRQLGDIRRIVMGDDGLGDLGLALLAEPGDDPPRVLLGPAVVVGVVQQAGDGPPRLVGRAGAVAMRRPSHRRLDPPGMIPQRRAVRPLVRPSPPRPRR